MFRDFPPKRIYWINLSVVFALLLLAHLVFPPLLYHWSPRDSDMGLWFSGGLLLGELSMFGLTTRWSYGPLQWRVIFGAALAILLIQVTAITVRICGPMSRADSIVLLRMLFGVSIFFAFCDVIYFRVTRLWLVRQQPTEDQLASEGKAAQSRQFGTAFLLAVVVLSAFIALMWRYALNANEIAYRSYRSYDNQGVPFLLLLVTFFWVLHILILRAVLISPLRSGLIVTCIIAILGTESIRRIEQWKNSTTLDYLNWEFSMIVMGFLVTHAIIGATIRWLGWEMKKCPAV